MIIKIINFYKNLKGELSDGIEMCTYFFVEIFLLGGME